MVYTQRLLNSAASSKEPRESLLEESGSASPRAVVGHEASEDPASLQRLPLMRQCKCDREKRRGDYFHCYTWNFRQAPGKVCVSLQ